MLSVAYYIIPQLVALESASGATAIDAWFLLIRSSSFFSYKEAAAVCWWNNCGAHWLYWRARFS